MDGSSRKEEACCPKLLDLISKEREWLVKRGGYNNTSNNIRRHGSSSSSDPENKLQLRLGLPGDDDDVDEGNYNNWSPPNPKVNNNSTHAIDNRDESLLTLNYFSSPASMSHHHHNVNNHNNKTSIIAGCQDQKQKQVMPCPSSWSGGCHHQQQLKNPSFLQYHQTPGSKMLPPPAPSTHTTTAVTKESSQPCCNRIVDLQTPPVQKKAFSQSPANTAVPNTSQKRAAPTPVVGWPPIRSFRKNLASTSGASTKPGSETQSKDVVKETKPVEANNSKGLFVKINMDGVAIGRKVDLHAYDSYEKLSSAVDELFSGLLAAQRDSSVGGIQNKAEKEEKSIAAGILDGSGEYTLTYEDNEGDRMLVGDVPWHMFVSTVKRLRVLKSSDLSSLSRARGKKVC